MMATKAHAFAVVRLGDDGMEWLDYESLASSPSKALHAASRSDQHTPEWATANPIARVVPVVVEEREEPVHASMIELANRLMVAVVTLPADPTGVAPSPPRGSKR